MAGKLRVTLVKSTISHTQRTRATVRALGLHRIGETVEVADTPELRGMTRAVRFLLRTEEVADAEAPAKPARAPASKTKEESKS
jgi:large subunit ribosomal protein L30